jgi:hypothetical protein
MIRLLHGHYLTASAFGQTFFQFAFRGTEPAPEFPSGARKYDADRTITDDTPVPCRNFA